MAKSLTELELKQCNTNKLLQIQSTLLPYFPLPTLGIRGTPIKRAIINLNRQSIESNNMLNAVEFKAKIKQGIIEIPEEYQQDLREDSEVQVIVIKQNKKISTTGIIAKLTQNPVAVKGIRQLNREEIHQL